MKTVKEIVEEWKDEVDKPIKQQHSIEKILNFYRKLYLETNYKKYWWQILIYFVVTSVNFRKEKKMREIPKEDMLVLPYNAQFSENEAKIYCDCVFCKCGRVIHFKNRNMFETVFIKCPECGHVNIL